MQAHPQHPRCKPPLWTTRLAVVMLAMVSLSNAGCAKRGRINDSISGIDESYSSSWQWQDAREDAQELMQIDGVSPSDVIRAYIFTYAFVERPATGPSDERGLRIWAQTSGRYWIEIWGSKRMNRLLVEGREVYNGAAGTVLLRLGDRPDAPEVEAFVPDRSNPVQEAFFRVTNKDGARGAWTDLQAVHLLK